jgi:hypothetical protein
MTLYFYNNIKYFKSRNIKLIIFLMGCSSSKSIFIKDLNIENELKEENEEIIDIDVFKDELKPPFEKKPEE